MNGLLRTYLCYTLRKPKGRNKAIAKKVKTDSDKSLPPDAKYPILIECRDKATALKIYRA